MTFFISEDAYITIDNITVFVAFIMSYGIPAIVPILFVILVPLFCCCGCMGKKYYQIQKKMTNIVQKIFFFLEKDGDRFIVYGYKAPICYTYFLFFMFLVLSVHCICNFWAGINGKNYELEQSDPDCYEFRDGIAVKLDTAINETCIDIQLIDGLEAASITFGLSALAVSFLTYILLTMTKGNSIKRKRTCQRFCCIASAVIIQIVLLIIPRVLILYYVTFFSDISNANIIDGLFEVNSVFSAVAIFDAISLTMFTPWLCFEKVKKPSKIITPGEIA